METTTHRVDWEGHRVHVVEQGEGPVLLLIMGLGGNCDMWQPLLPFLSGRRVIAFDAPGTGRTATPMMPVGVPALARLAAAVLEALDVDSADALGYSYGGAVAQELAAQRPDLIRRLILVATTMGAGSALGDPAATRELANPMRYYDPNLFERTAKTVYGGRVGRDPELRRALAASRSANPPTPLGYTWQLVAGWGWTSRLLAPLITQPTLVLCGDDDPLVPLVNSEALASSISGARLQILPGAGHLLLLDQPQDAGRIISEFIDAASPPAAAA